MNHFVENFPSGQGMIEAVNVFVGIGVVVVVLEKQVTAANPTHVQITVSSDLKNIAPSNISGVIFFLDLKIDIPRTLQEARQCPVAFFVTVQAESVAP